jgi:2-methylcitrate dehydratase PrpD
VEVLAHSAVDSALDFRQQQQWAGDEALACLADVHVETYAPGYEIVKEQNPRTPYQAKFSLAYCVAAGLLEGWVGLDQFTPERFGAEGVREAKIAALLGRVRVSVAPDITANYPAEWGTRVAFTLNDGGVRTMSAAFPRGNPENPVSTAALEDKFRALVAPRLGLELAELAIQAVHGLEVCDDMARAFAHVTVDR